VDHNSTTPEHTVLLSRKKEKRLKVVTEVALRRKQDDMTVSLALKIFTMPSEENKKP